MANNDKKDDVKQPDMYTEYENGATVQELADKYKLETGEVLATIQAVQESNEK